jgi:hypothetical protein
MSWEHQIAKQFKERDNPVNCVWFRGTVQSPVRTVNDKGEESFHGPLSVSAFDGQVILGDQQLRVLSHVPQVYAPQSVAIVGNPFAKSGGSQTFVLLGVIE